MAGSDFYAAPRPSPDGRTLVWLEWDHPDMPWDAVRLRAADVADDGRLGPARTIAGGPDVSIVQPAWRADGVLHFVSDAPSGWWNLFALDGDGGLDGPARNLAPMEAELGDPAWVFGRSSYAFTETAGSWPWPAPTAATPWYGSRRTVPSNPWTRRSARSRGSRSRAGPRC